MKEKIKILLVEDNQVSLELGKEILETAEYEVVAAHNGAEALKLLPCHNISVIITDILMPDIDGYSLCYQVRTNKEYNAIPIIIYSATYISQNDEELALEIGADKYIRKPASIELLLETIKDIIASPRKLEYKITGQHELSEITRIYNSQFIEKLESKNRELEEAKHKILESEQRFRAIIENSFEAIVLRDHRGAVVYQSPGAEKITGYTTEELKDTGLASFIHPDDMEQVMARMETVRRNPKKPVHGINRIRHKSGRYIWIEGYTANLLEDENVKAMVGNFRDITERKLSEEKLEKRELRFKALLENNVDAISLLDEHGKITYHSPGAERLLGYTPEEILGSQGIDFFHPDDVQGVRERLVTALKNPGMPIFRTNRLRHKDGHYIWVDGTTTNLLHDENIRAFVGNFHDITERKLAEAKSEENDRRLAAERARFSNLFLQAPSCICILAGPDHVYEMANPLYLQITGKKDIIGKTAEEVFPELVEQGFLGLLGNVYKTGLPFSGKEAFIQLDVLENGELTDQYMDFVYQPYKDDNGKVEGIFFFANLVTEQVLARKKTEQNENHFRALVENATDLVVKTDEQGRITYVSPAHVKLTGCSVQEILGRSFFSFQHPDYVQELKQKFKELLASPGVPMPRVSRFRRRDGTYSWVEGTVINLLNDENVKGIVCNFHDISDSKLAEQKLIHANRLYVFISQINQIIVHITDKAELYREACRIAITIGKYQMAWIGEVDVPNKRISLVDSCGIAQGDVYLFDNVRYEDKGPQDRAITSGEYYVCNNVQQDLETVGWKPFAAMYSLRSCMVLPIKCAGVTVATFNLYSSEQNLFDEQEIALLREVAGDISFALDVFEKEKKRQRMEQELIHSEMRLKQAQAIAHVGSWELDYISGAAIWSDEFCKIYGLSPLDNRQTFQTWISFIHPDDVAYTKQVLNDARKASSNFAFHHRIIIGDGEIRHIYSQAEFVFDHANNPVMLHGVAHDITKMKKAELERTKIIADMVQRNNDLEQFSYIVSHNLRAPVANILGLVDIMQNIGIEKEEAESVTKFLGTAAEKLDHVIKDINDILEVKNDLNGLREKVNFDSLLKSLRSGIENNVSDDLLNIKSDFSAVQEINTVKTYIYSIFFNLISNSIKYRRPGAALLIDISSSRVNNRVRLIFKDNGLGIDLGKNGRDIFGLYKRFHHQIEGKGMGLFMVKTQVEILGGKISVESEVNAGATFTIEFDEKVS